MRDPEEALEDLTAILEELKERSNEEVVLVEGQKDRAALTVLGIDGEVWQVQGPNTIFSTAERLATEGRSAIILTDWDRKGGQLARLLRQDLRANGVRFDDELRLRLVLLVKAEIKDIESLPAFFTRLVSLAQSSEAERRSKIIRDRKARKEYRPKP
ncbi:MAG: Toprim subdomain protein [Methanomassiliicoccales archaeon]|jgi:dTMP kinase|nr:Toprim subdomain protein [Methanomassiliicoccales archaeon]MDD1755419.1 Toprim subdomain protein [Methanomassiliicoccales archaeon]